MIFRLCSAAWIWSTPLAITRPGASSGSGPGFMAIAGPEVSY